MILAGIIYGLTAVAVGILLALPPLALVGIVYGVVRHASRCRDVKGE